MLKLLRKPLLQCNQHVYQGIHVMESVLFNLLVNVQIKLNQYVHQKNGNDTKINAIFGLEDFGDIRVWKTVEMNAKDKVVILQVFIPKKKIKELPKELNIYRSYI